jgi:hypothetical protein
MSFGSCQALGLRLLCIETSPVAPLSHPRERSLSYAENTWRGHSPRIEPFVIYLKAELHAAAQGSTRNPAHCSQTIEKPAQLLGEPLTTAKGRRSRMHRCDVSQKKMGRDAWPRNRIQGRANIRLPAAPRVGGAGDHRLIDHARLRLGWQSLPFPEPNRNRPDTLCAAVRCSQQYPGSAPTAA